MTFFRDMPVGKKFLAIYGLIIIMLAIMAIFANTALTRTYNIASELNRTVETSYVIPAQLNDEVVNAGRAINFATQVDKPSDLNLGDLDGRISKINSLMAAVTSTNFPERVTELKGYIDNLNNTYTAKIRPLLAQGQFREAFVTYRSEYTPVSIKVSSLCATFLIDQLHDLENQTDDLASPTTMYIMRGGSVLIILLLALFGWYTTREIVNAVERLVKRAEEMAHLDFSHSVKVDRKDEFGQLEQSFEDLRQAIGQKMNFIQGATDQVTTNSQNIHSLMTTTQQSASQAESNSLTVAAAADQMVSTTQDIARNCEAAANASTTTRDITNQGLQAVQDAVLGINNQAEQTKKDAELVKNLANQSQNIGSIVQTIDDIAAQTNLLALNAAIEAARAGEAGRGFAVVADEVRALASRTTKSTQEISAMVVQIQKEADVAATSMASSVDSMDNLASHANSVEQTLNDIMTHVNEVNNQITQIATAAEEQTTATSEVSQNMQNITHLLQDVAQDTNSVTGHIDSTVNRIEELRNEVAQFKLS
ncbi:MAG: methyl-accepting chemotaxis protein [Anaerobiospirillum sp.]|nr:methyl-accepting chemotaxis protein [Anaerobiospirillum sp.]